jgi:hypothetical protein
LVPWGCCSLSFFKKWRTNFNFIKKKKHSLNLTSEIGWKKSLDAILVFKWVWN